MRFFIVLTLSLLLLTPIIGMAGSIAEVQQHLRGADQALGNMQQLVASQSSVKELNRALLKRNQALNKALIAAQNIKQEKTVPRTVVRQAYRHIQNTTAHHVTVLKGFLSQTPIAAHRGIKEAIAQSKKGRTMASRELKALRLPKSEKNL